MAEEKCKGRIYAPEMFRGDAPCSRNAKRDGYCNQHHPDAEAKRKENHNARYKQQARGWDLEHAVKKAERDLLQAVRRYGLVGNSVADRALVSLRDADAAMAAFRSEIA